MFAMALARDPEILILDEPTAGLDPAARAELLELIQEFMMDEEKTVIFSTYITSDLEKIADYIALIAGDTTVWSRMIGGGDLLEVLFGMMLIMTGSLTGTMCPKNWWIRTGRFSQN